MSNRNENDRSEEVRYQRRDVVWGIDPFKANDEAERPFLVLNNETHPFAGEQVAAVALTTTPRSAALEIDPDDWELGELPRQSYISPWIVVTRDYTDIVRSIGRLRNEIVDRTLSELVMYLSASDSNS